MKETNMKKTEKNIIELVDFVAFLKTSELFSDLPSHYLSVFKELFKEVSLGAGESLFREGDEDHSLYLIRKGKVGLQQKEKEILQVGEGDCIGTLSVLLHSPRTATALVLEDAELLKLTSQDLDDILITYPEVALNLLKILARRLRKANSMYIEQSVL
jgi:CRP-like cAMP-binding protein